MLFWSVGHNVKHPKAERLEDYCLTGVSEIVYLIEMGKLQSKHGELIQPLCVCLFILKYSVNK